MKKKPARSADSDNLEKTQRLNIRLDAYEDQLWREAARVARLDLSQWIRLRLNEAGKRELGRG